MGKLGASEGPTKLGIDPSGAQRWRSCSETAERDDVEMIRIVYIVSAPEQVVRIFLRGHLQYLGVHGFKVALVCPPGVELDEAVERESVAGFGVPIARDIAPAKDLLCLARLVLLLRRLKPDVVTAGTPKAGFLGMLAARLSGVRTRVYHLHALRLETASGVSRRILTLTERLAASCATRIISVSDSLRYRYIALGLAPAEKITVLEQGSANGVDASVFDRARLGTIQRATRRSQLGIGPVDPVIGFVGRVIPDKGVEFLVDAFETVLLRFPRAWLLLIGQTEAHHPLPRGLLPRIQRHPRIIRLGYQRNVVEFYQLIDVLAFPSLREGFGNVALEAGAAGVPVVGFSVTGVVDSVVHGRTGTLVRPRDASALSTALCSYLGDVELRNRHGEEGRKRAGQFSPESLWAAFALEYRRLLVSE